MNAKSQLGRRVLFRAYLIYFSIAALVTLGHLIYEYDFEKSRAQNKLHEILEGMKQPIVQALYRFDQNDLSHYLDKLLEQREFTYVCLHDETDYKLMDRGTVSIQHMHSSEGWISRKLFSNGEYLGTLNVYSPPSLYMEEVEHSIYLVLLSAFIKSVILWFIIFWVLKSLVGRRLNELTTAIHKVSKGEKGMALQKLKGPKDELTLIMDEFNDMAKIIQEREEALELHNQRLDEMVQSKTKDLTQALEHANKESGAKSRFLSMIGHELRTPLNGILGLGEELKLSKLDQEQKTQLKHILESAGELKSAINDILSFANLEKGRGELEVNPVRVDELIDSVDTIFQPRLKAEGLTLLTSVEMDRNEEISIDVRKVRQVLVHLLDNARKYSHTGTIRLGVKKEKDDTLIFTVEDEGVGIPEERIHDLFEGFSRIGAHTEKSEGGRGLGLALCNHLVTLMGGRLGVSSELGKGSQFWFVVPLKLNKTIQNLPTEENHSTQKILVVEDNAINAKVLRGILSKKGFQVGLATHGAEALERLKEYRYDLIITDLQMPVMDGFEFMEELQKLSPSLRPPVITCSANYESGEMERCQKLGSLAFIRKPIRSDIVLSSIQDALGCGDNSRKEQA